MPQSTHDRAAELHNITEHAHDAAATGHGKGTQLTPHEETVRAAEHDKDHNAGTSDGAANLLHGKAARLAHERESESVSASTSKS